MQGRQALPLPETVRFAGRDGLDAFAMQAPLSARLRPAGGDEVMKVRLALGSAVLVVVFPDMRPDSANAIAELRANLAGHLYRFGETRPARIAGTDGHVVDVRLPAGSLREYRFVRDGVVWGVGLLTRHGDRTSLATAEAMVESWRWVA